MARAVSTVLDVALCLLLVTIAAGTLALAVPDETRSTTVESESAAESISTVTATVNAGEKHTVHATLAEHLARAAMLEVRMDDARLRETPYPDNVRRAVGEDTEERVHITAEWIPYPDAPLEGRISVGATPPSTADVAATTLDVDSRLGSPEPSQSVSSLAETIARMYIEWLFPPERTRIGLVDPRTAPDTADRYREAAAAIGTDVESAIANASSTRANERLVTELAGQLEADLQDRDESVEAVAAESDIGSVSLVVRRWEP